MLMETKVNQLFSQWVGAVIKLAHKEEQGLSWRQTSETSFEPLVSSLDFSTLCICTVFLLSAYLRLEVLFMLPLSLSWKPLVDILYVANLIGLVTMVCIWTALGSGAVSVLEAVKVCLGAENMPWSIIEQGLWGQRFSQKSRHPSCT